MRRLHVQRTCEANAAGENSSFLQCVKSVSLHRFKLACVV